MAKRTRRKNTRNKKFSKKNNKTKRINKRRGKNNIIKKMKGGSRLSLCLNRMFHQGETLPTDNEQEPSETDISLTVEPSVLDETVEVEPSTEEEITKSRYDSLKINHVKIVKRLLIAIGSEPESGNLSSLKDLPYELVERIIYFYNEIPTDITTELQREICDYFNSNISSLRFDSDLNIERSPARLRDPRVPFKSTRYGKRAQAQAQYISPSKGIFYRDIVGEFPFSLFEEGNILKCTTKEYYNPEQPDEIVFHKEYLQTTYKIFEITRIATTFRKERNNPSFSGDRPILIVELDIYGFVYRSLPDKLFTIYIEFGRRHSEYQIVDRQRGVWKAISRSVSPFLIKHNGHIIHFEIQ